jgi:aminopeptidase N
MLTFIVRISRKSEMAIRLMIAGLILVVSGCMPGRQITHINTVDTEVAQSEPTPESAPQPTRSWIIPDHQEQFLRPRTWDLQHQKLWIRFDFSEPAVLGATELLLTSISSNNQQLILDAKTMDIHQIQELKSGTTLSFEQQERTINIDLSQVSPAFGSGDSLIVRIEFTARPPERGLYFVNPRGESDKPRQVWTLGQPEDNSYWFPTIDHPAERMTTELWLAVPNQYTTISNGRLLQSLVLPGDSLRTDYWHMDKPHAPYLVALAMGEYEIYEEMVNGVLLRYATEPAFAPYVNEIYRNTADMLRYFEEKLGVSYPWDIYAQVPVRDFIAGGMENTTATFLYEHVQVTARQALDVEHQDLIAHEIIHQWFGNLVTTKDWANLPMNEGFANYFEALYRYHRDGENAGDWTLNNFRQNYFSEARRFRRPVITNRYSEPEDMYDRHSYEKAGLILRMLHSHMGDDHWWGSLNTYLNRHAFNSIDFRDLQMVSEQQSGESYAWFFDQWFTQPGHPEISVNIQYNQEKVIVNLRQIQDLELQPLYRLPLEIHYATDIGEPIRFNLDFFTADTTIVLENYSGKAGEVIVDPYRIILAEYQENIDSMTYISRLAHPASVLRFEAVNWLGVRLKEQPDLIEVLKSAYASEVVPGIRQRILQYLSPLADSSWNPFIESINHLSEPYFANRILAASMSFAVNGNLDNSYLKYLLDDPSYYVEKHVVELISVE